LEWEPEAASVSASADLGWTWGHWEFTASEPDDDSDTSHGKYVFIWKKVDGDWRIVANIWNDSPSPD
jgi:ketosteroid isomerase-like protein